MGIAIWFRSGLLYSLADQRLKFQRLKSFQAQLVQKKLGLQRKDDQRGLNLLMLNMTRCFSPPFLPGFSGPMLHQLRVASANAQTLKIHIDAK